MSNKTKQDLNKLLTIASFWALLTLCEKLINKGANNFDEAIEIALKRNHIGIVNFLKEKQKENK